MWGLVPYMAYTGTYRCMGYGFDPSALNRVYNFKRICPDQGLDPSYTGYGSDPVV